MAAMIAPQMNKANKLSQWQPFVTRWERCFRNTYEQAKSRTRFTHAYPLRESNSLRMVPGRERVAMKGSLLPGERKLASPDSCCQLVESIWAFRHRLDSYSDYIATGRNVSLLASSVSCCPVRLETGHAEVAKKASFFSDGNESWPARIPAATFLQAFELSWQSLLSRQKCIATWRNLQPLANLAQSSPLRMARA